MNSRGCWDKQDNRLLRNPPEIVVYSGVGQDRRNSPIAAKSQQLTVSIVYFKIAFSPVHLNFSTYPVILFQFDFICSCNDFRVVIIIGIGMNDDLWDRVCGLSNETWKGYESSF